MKFKGLGGAWVLSVAAVLAGCGGQDPTTTGASGSAGGSVSASQADNGPSFSTLGTRTSTARQVPITKGNGQKWFDYDRPVDFPGVTALPTQYIKMSDGAELAATISLPAKADGTAADGKFPVILIQTSYNKRVGSYVPALGGADPYLVQRGYATVVVDVRGTGNSDGVWRAFDEREQQDYGEVVNWVANQAWSNGSIGVYGVSYLGITAMLTASQGNPAVKAAFPIVPIGDGYRDIVFTGGQVNPTFIPLWLGLVTGLGSVPFDSLQTDPQKGLTQIVQHLLSAVNDFQGPTIVKAVTGDSNTAYDGDFWKTRSPLEVAKNVKVPTFVVGGLHDLFQRSEPLWFENLKQNTTTKLLIGPWTHIQAGGVPSDGLPADAVPAMNHIELMWFDQYLKGMNAKADSVPNVTQFVQGYGHYVSTSNWPHPNMQATALYLHGDNSLSANQPVAGEQSNTILQAPVFGLCSLSTSQWTAGIAGFVPLPCFSEDTFNQIPSANFRTPVLADDLYLNGPIEADVWISTTSLDASLSVRVSDYDPATGKSLAITNGLLTASHRAVDDTRSRFINGLRIQPWHPFTQAAVQPVNMNEPMLLPVEIFPTSAMIPKGHQLQISIASSNLPQGLPPLVTLVKGAVGVVTILNDDKHVSKVVLPVVPNTALK
ncbi:CocE/NonD family hydrolase [Limnobacter litoralis]|uniref:Peptidase n=1 Tax=Limnobacter litoralis TaxID=481366 RepID=A0ABQ5YT35_9BURK|nr:CocE/NonD family hydrolase [Limnobacter litoralis]GLR27061.1 putative peptidase [Limnobacter litoralis]